MIATLLLAAAMTADPAANWPGFRGDGSSTAAAKDLPATWSPTENLAWRTALPGYGQSSPVVWDGRIFVTAVNGANKETLTVAAVDGATGKLEWAKDFAATRTGKNNPMMSRAGPTPVVDAAGVYAFFESGDVIALDPTGTLRWRRSLAADYGDFKNNHGIAASPAQTDRGVVVLIDDAAAAYLVALDKATGKNLWKTDRPGKTSWTSPVVAAVGGTSAVFVSSGGALNAYAAADGKALGELGGLVGNTIPSPTVAGNLVVVGAGENRMKPDAAASARSNRCVRVGPGFKFETVWEAKKAISHHASPLVHAGHAYFVTKTGFVHCHDLSTGEELYAERLDNPCWATPVGAGANVYFFGKDGVTTVLKAGPTFEKAAANRFWSSDDFAARRAEAKQKAEATLPKPPEGKGQPVPKDDADAARYAAVGDVVYGVAAAGGAFYVRTGTELLCVRAGKPAR